MAFTPLLAESFCTIFSLFPVVARSFLSRNSLDVLRFVLFSTHNQESQINPSIFEILNGMNVHDPE